MHEEDKISPLVKASLLHSQFEMIHPFLDGNGRLGRLLIAFYLSSKDILHKPTLYLSKYFMANRNEYYEHLYNIHTKGDYETFIKIFLFGVIKTADEAVNIAREISFLRSKDIKKINSLDRTSENAMVIFEGLFSKPAINIQQAAENLKTSVSSASRLLDKLLEVGILKLLDNKKRKKIFIYGDYMNIFNKD